MKIIINYMGVLLVIALVTNQVISLDALAAWLGGFTVDLLTPDRGGQLQRQVPAARPAVPVQPLPQGIRPDQFLPRG